MPDDSGRLLINALSAQHGGGQVYLDNLLQHVPESLKPRLLVLVDEDSAWLRRDDGIRCVTSRFASRGVLPRMLHECLALPWLLRRWRVRVYFSPNGVTPPWAPRRMRLAAAFQLRAPPRQLYPWGYLRARLWLLQRLQQRTLQRSALRIFMTRSHAEAMLGAGAARARGIQVIPHGLEPMFMAASPPTAHMPDEYVLYASALQPYKRHADVVAAWQALRRQRPGTREKLVFVGLAYPRYLKQLRAQIDAAGLEREIIVAGAVEHAQMPSIYRHAKLHVFASQVEAFGIALLEKMASGAPVLCVRDEGLFEVADDGVAWFEPGDVPALAAMMATYLDNASQRAELAAQGRRRAAEFSWPRSAERTWQALDALLRSAAD